MSGGRNEGMNFGNVAVESGTGGAGIMVAAVAQVETFSVGSVGGGHMKRDCPKRAKEK